MAQPVFTTGAAGNALASQSLAAGASASFNVDLSNAWEGHLQVGCTFGTVAATAGLQVTVVPRVGTTPVADTSAGVGSLMIPAAATSAAAQTVKLQTGRYSVTLKNTDVTNGLTLVYATLDTVSSVV